MASVPMREDAFVSSLSITLSEPTAGDPYTYIASGFNAAIAIAAAMESLNPQVVIDLLAARYVSADFQSLKACYHVDRKRVQADGGSDTEERLDFILDMALCRMFLAGVRYAGLSKEVRDAA